MTYASKLLVAVAAALCAAAPLAHAQSSLPSPNWASAVPSGPDARIKITEQYARMVARDAYSGLGRWSTSTTVGWHSNRRRKSA